MYYKTSKWGIIMCQLAEYVLGSREYFNCNHYFLVKMKILNLNSYVMTYAHIINMPNTKIYLSAGE